MSQIRLYLAGELLFNKTFPPETKLFFSCQANHLGLASIKKIESIRNRLFEQSSDGITFNESKISAIITGGNCSAIALEFAHSYISAKEDLCKKIGEDIFRSQAKSQVLLLLIKRLGKIFHTSNEEMRTRQGAYNTIEVLPSLENIDFSKEKIQSIANYHNFKIDITTDEINSYMISQPEDIRDYVCSLPQGIYLLRIIKPAENEKLEEYGHSTIYIQEEPVKVFFDPNRGAFNISHEDIAKKFYAIFQSQLLQFNVSQVRFYRLTNKAFL